MDYTIKRTKGTNVKIKVKTDGTVVVTAPTYVSTDQIHTIVLEKENWIKLVQEQILQEEQSAPDQLIYLGERIETRFGEYDQISLDHNILDVPYFDDEAVFRSNLKEWYTHQTRALIEETIYGYANELGVGINRITIRDQRTRWGSCSSLNNLNFNWRLSMAPMEVVQYVMIHEVCHLVHMNHSKQFWGLVETMMPGYEKSRQWLTKHGRMMFRMIESIPFYI